MKEKTIKWLAAAGERAVRTMAQTALSLFSVGMVATEVDWKTVVSASVVAGIYSLLMSIAGLPELKEPKEGDDIAG